MITQFFRNSSVQVDVEPFPHFVIEQAFGSDPCNSLLGWLETEAPWRLVETDFYEQYEFSLIDVQTPADLSFLSSDEYLDRIRLKVERAFGTTLLKAVDCTAHKLTPGQRIRIHNDFVEGRETHRLLLQLNRGWREDDGGFLMLFRSADPADVDRIIPPLHGTVIGFEISRNSHHAVSTIHGGSRYTVVYSFYASSR
jgi:Rps23 Pro-64 3,4-dihydroxylase Tpa1-like proline 4-hydroxylase